MFFWRKSGDFHPVCLLFFLFVAFFSSSFEVNLNVHRRNWRGVPLLAPAAGWGAGLGARGRGQKRSTPVPCEI